MKPGKDEKGSFVEFDSFDCEKKPSEQQIKETILLRMKEDREWGQFAEGIMCG